uniref:Uncharacterized protein n=1 Tax=Nelumbo nucifera TaxID=4432 RepID=A0A822XY63_NELNU|nr:TPA_asm: hypothetical protein HUJ06_025158 [Nelumbo nucifera]
MEQAVICFIGGFYVKPLMDLSSGFLFFTHLPKCGVLGILVYVDNWITASHLTKVIICMCFPIYRSP